MKTVTVDQIMSWRPCEDPPNPYTRERIEELRKSVCGERKNISVLDILNTNIPDIDKAWCILRKEFFTEKQLQKIAIFCSKLVLHPKDDHPRKAIKAVKNYLHLAVVYVVVYVVGIKEAGLYNAVCVVSYGARAKENTCEKIFAYCVKLLKEETK